MPEQPNKTLVNNKTPMELEAQRQKWQAAAIARRKVRRDTDPEYRDQHRAASREYFRNKHGVDPSEFRDCRKNLDKLDEIGTVRFVREEEFLTFHLAELANALGGYHANIMRRWIDRGQIPAPVLRSEDGVEVYLEAEVEAIIEPLGEQQATYAYFRKNHTTAIQNIADAVDTVRQELGIS